MAKITGSEIERLVAEKKLIIRPFNKERLNPNSYNLAIAAKLLVYKPRRWCTPWRKPLVWGEQNSPDYAVNMNPDKGFVIRPGWFYLGSTVEYTSTPDLVPILDGRSSTGRLSLHVHATAGFGDIGFEGCWTLEIYSIIPVRIFPGIPICQISYDTVQGKIIPYSGRYKGYNGPVSYQPPVDGKHEPKNYREIVR